MALILRVQSTQHGILRVSTRNRNCGFGKIHCIWGTWTLPAIAMIDSRPVLWINPDRPLVAGTVESETGQVASLAARIYGKAYAVLCMGLF